MEQNTEEIEIDLKEIFYMLKEKLIFIICLACLAGLVTGMVCKYILPEKYQSTAKLFLLSKSTSLTSLTDLQMGSSLAKDYIELIQSRPVMEAVIEKEALTDSVEELRKKVSAQTPTDTRVLHIIVTYENPQTAMKIANDLAEITRKDISQIMGTNEPGLVEDAIVEAKAVAPSTIKNIVISMILMSIAVAGIIVLLYLLNDKIKTADDVEKYLELNVLASIPLSK